MAGIYFTTSLMTMFISNTATAVLLAPIAMQSATQIGVSPVPFLFAVTLGASMCFASPFSTPPNALVMPAGQYTFMDYVKVGLPLQIIMGIVMVLVLPLLFPFKLFIIYDADDVRYKPSDRNRPPDSDDPMAGMPASQ